MVFSSIPAYLDPSNWQQQQDPHQIIGSCSSTNPLIPPPPPPPPQPHGGGIGAIRPGSMAERARMANVPMPETPLKCPRCESTNTKFCYFNNYSLSQPRHFCKTCRRYWTRGGALRSVPVGGGCRRNKRSSNKSTTTTSSKSPANNNNNMVQTTSTSTSNLSGSINLQGLTPPQQQLQPLRFMSPLSHHQLSTDNFAGDINGLNLNYDGVSAPIIGTSDMMNFNCNLLGGGGIEPWRLQQTMQQFPFFGGSTDNGIYHQFQGGGGGGGDQLPAGFVGSAQNNNIVNVHADQMMMRPKVTSSFLSQLSSVKMEGNPHELNLSRQLMGGGGSLQGNDNQWNTASANWTELSSFSSSSTSNAL